MNRYECIRIDPIGDGGTLLQTGINIVVAGYNNIRA
jgi:hypothetical protein